MSEDDVPPFGEGDQVIWNPKYAEELPERAAQADATFMVIKCVKQPIPTDDDIVGYARMIEPRRGNNLSRAMESARKALSRNAGKWLVTIDFQGERRVIVADAFIKVDAGGHNS